MKKLKDILANIGWIVLAVVVVAAGLLLADYSKGKTSLGAPMDANIIQKPTLTSTTTGSYCAGCPVKVLEGSYNREYALIVNNSDTNVYLWIATSTNCLNLTGSYSTGCTNFVTSTGALGSDLTTGGTPPGIRLNAGGGSYEINSDNLIINDIWATSTAVTKEIQVTYK